MILMLCGNGYYPTSEMYLGFATGTTLMIAAQGIEGVFIIKMPVCKNVICCFLSACMLTIPILLIFYFPTMIINYVWQIMFSIGIDFSTIVICLGKKCYQRYYDTQNILIEI